MIFIMMKIKKGLMVLEYARVLHHLRKKKMSPLKN